jgi:hypothetical protein
VDWLADQAYLIYERISLGHVCLELYQWDEDGSFALTLGCHDLQFEWLHHHLLKVEL